MFQIDKTDFDILTAFQLEQNGTSITIDNPTNAIRISDITTYLNTINVSKCRRTVYLHLTKLTQNGYVAKGIVDNHADTYYITPKGQQALKGESI